MDIFNKIYLRITSIFIAVIAFFINCSIPSYAIETEWLIHLNTSNGLSENNVKSITQDCHGFMWFGTKNGLNRYDGNLLKTYDVFDCSLNVGNNNISALCESYDGLLWIGTDKGVYTYDVASDTFHFFSVRTKDGIMIDDWISQILQDPTGNIWIISPPVGAFRYNPEDCHLVKFSAGSGVSAQTGNFECMCLRANGDIWFGTNGSGLFEYDIKTSILRQYLSDKNGNSLEGRNIYALCDCGGYLAIAIHEEELLRYSPEENLLSQIDCPDVHYKILRALLFCDGHLYVGTQNGLFIIDNDGTYFHETESALYPHGLSDNMIYSMFCDRDGGIWVGTIKGGVNYAPQSGLMFKNYVPGDAQGDISGRRISEIQKDPDGNIWISAEDGHLDVMDSLGTFRAVNFDADNAGVNRLALMVDGDYVWSGLFKGGLDIIHRFSMESTHFNPSELGISDEGSPYALYKDSRGIIWLGTASCVYTKDEGRMTFSKEENLPRCFAQDIVEDQNGIIWIATIGGGLLRYNRDSASVKCYRHSAENHDSISSNDVTSITLAQNGSLLLATERGGLCIYDPQKDTFTCVDKADGLPDDIIYKILEGEDGALWFGTNHGLVRYDRNTREVRVFKRDNGLIGNQFNNKSALLTPSGMMFFGGTEGLTRVNPKLFGTKAGHKVYITDIWVNRKEIASNDNDMFQGNILYCPKVTLPFDFNEVRFAVSSMELSNINTYTFNYRMLGVNKDWISTDDGSNITFSQLPPGHYTFEICLTSHSDDMTRLEIVVRPPWWKSIIANVIYMLVLAVIIYAIVYFIVKSQRVRIEQKELDFKENQEKELLKYKIKFFADVAHEIRTPLSLINLALENIERKNILEEEITRNINTISQNSRRLISLVNQLLDFQKMDNNCVRLHYMNTDICELIKYVVYLFKPTLDSMHKSISLNTDKKSYIVPIDKEAVTKILSNLINNARKYSETFIRVHVTDDDDKIVISVVNDGKRIPSNKKEIIFNPLTRLDNAPAATGYGMGLALSRSIATLHGGSLIFDDTSEYNKFILRLPKHQENVVSIQDGTINLTSVIVDDVTGENLSKLVIAPRKYTVLIVEDNMDLIRMIKYSLLDSYNILDAANGRDAIDIVHSHQVDLIVSDIIMPVMDGLELCSSVKSDNETKHIPIILLTAYESLDSRIEGLKAGADAYLAKPFSANYLKEQIDSILKNRERERESYLHKPYLPIQKGNISRSDVNFLERASKIVDHNISNPEFNVSELAQCLCMSRSSLNRKIKEISSVTPVIFIRTIRLKKAAELLNDGLRASEVSEKIGISSVSYFIKQFQNQFGVTPKEFTKKVD